MSQLKGSQHLKIPFREIKEATKNFKTFIGRGGYGSVYKGELLISGQLTTVAVKRLDKQQSMQGMKQFLTEIELLKGQKHRNLISLLGYCDERDEMIIVYEYAERGGLDQYIKHDKNTYPLSWLQRLKICVVVAHGLDYLHNHAGKHQAIIHRDMKSANILLDCNWVAKVSDFGLSKLSLAGLGRSTVISDACGTTDYIEPEYLEKGTVMIESDVYSFGMVLLEILSGRLCGEKYHDGLSLKDHYEQDKLNLVIDPNVEINLDSFVKFESIAKGCLHGERKQRLPISRVVKELEEALKIEESLVKEKGKRSGSVPFNTLYTRRTNVGKIFDIFDLNRDGCLSRKEVAAFLFVTKPDEEPLSTCVDAVFSSYPKYIDRKKGLSYHGLLKYYDDDLNDLGSDIKLLVSDSDDSDRRKNLIWLFQKLNSKEFVDLKPPVQVFGWQHKRDVTSSSLLTMDDVVTIDRPDLGSEVLKLLLKPDDEPQAALSLTSPESLGTVKPFTIRAILLYLLVVVVILSIAMVLVKVKHMWFVFLILFNSVNVLLNYRKKMQ